MAFNSLAEKCTFRGQTFNQNNAAESRTRQQSSAPKAADLAHKLEI